ncbi:MAG: chorismate synthase [Lachnospiraceae bacterium]|nr:chorismate synthase [Lachnospiraceae bacterium]
MSNIIGDKFRVNIFGQSHSRAIGVVMEGLPAGFEIDMERLCAFMARRAPGGELATKRREADIPEFISGLSGGKTCGAPLTAIIRNNDAHSGDYSNIKDMPRPGHADYTAYVKYNGFNDIAGGGQFSGRLTAPLCIAGGIAVQLLEKRGIGVYSHIYSIADIKDTPYALCGPFVDVSEKELPVINNDVIDPMKQAIQRAREELDSIGGIIECALTGVPAGLGEPMFGGIENRIAGTVFGIPAVKGIEFGRGFEAALLKGSENNDEFCIEAAQEKPSGISPGEDLSEGSAKPSGISFEIRTRTNNHGGILGGITSGMPVVFRAAFKPTPSIAREQKSVSLSRMEEGILTIKGRHDPCIAVRAVPCIEAAAAVVMLDLVL